LSSPDVVWALVPAVASALENAVLTFNLIKKPRPTHNTAHIYYYKKLSLLALHPSLATKLSRGTYPKFRSAKNFEFIKPFWFAS